MSIEAKYLPFSLSHWLTDSPVIPASFQQTIGNAAGVLKADNGAPIPIACRLSIGAVYDATVAPR